jgi:hypothetical protein
VPARTVVTTNHEFTGPSFNLKRNVAIEVLPLPER